MFKNSLKNLKTTKVLCMSAILAALFVVLYAAKLPLSNELRITFTFVPLAIAGWLFGPVPAMLVGFVGDVVSALLFPMGPYFPGFTLTSVLTGVIFGVCLFEKDGKMMVTGAIISKFLVNMLLNTALNAFWLSIISSKGYVFYLGEHFVKNIIALPAEVIILIIVFKVLSNNRIKKIYK